MKKFISSFLVFSLLLTVSIFSVPSDYNVQAEKDDLFEINDKVFHPSAEHFITEVTDEVVTTANNDKVIIPKKNLEKTIKLAATNNKILLNPNKYMDVSDVVKPTDPDAAEINESFYEELDSLMYSIAQESESILSVEIFNSNTPGNVISYRDFMNGSGSSPRVFTLGKNPEFENKTYYEINDKRAPLNTESLQYADKDTVLSSSFYNDLEEKEQERINKDLEKGDVLVSPYTGLNNDMKDLQSTNTSYQASLTGFSEDNYPTDRSASDAMRLGEYSSDRKAVSDEDPKWFSLDTMDTHFDKKYGDLPDREPGKSSRAALMSSAPIGGDSGTLSGVKPAAVGSTYSTSSYGRNSNKNTVCNGVYYPPSKWYDVDTKEHVIHGVYAIRMSMKPVVPINLGLMDDSQTIEWRRTHRPQSAPVILTNFGKELQKVQEEGLLDKIKRMPEAQGRREFTKLKRRLYNASQEDLPLIKILLSEENQLGFARGGAFTITENAVTAKLTFGHQTKERYHYTCKPVYSKTEWRYGSPYDVYVPMKVLQKKEGPVEDSIAKFFRVRTEDWKILRSYQIIGLRCPENMDYLLWKAGGRAYEDNAYAGSGRSHVMYSREATYFNKMSIRQFYTGKGCEAGLVAKTDRKQQEIDNYIRAFRDGAVHKVSFDPFYPIDLNKNESLKIPDHALYSEVALWGKSTPEEMGYFAKGIRWLTKDRSEKMEGEWVGFEIESTWASEDGKPVKLMFLYDFLADLTTYVPTEIGDTDALRFTKRTEQLILSVPVSTKTKEHQIVNVVNLPKDLIPHTRDFMPAAKDQHFTVEFVKAGSIY